MRDPVTPASVETLAVSPGQALGALYQVMAHSIGIAMQNAVAQQQQMNTVSAAVTTQGVSMLYSMDSAATAEATQTVLQSTLPQLLAELQAIAKGLKAPTI